MPSEVALDEPTSTISGHRRTSIDERAACTEQWPPSRTDSGLTNGSSVTSTRRKHVRHHEVSLMLAWYRWTGWRSFLYAGLIDFSQLPPLCVLALRLLKSSVPQPTLLGLGYKWTWPLALTHTDCWDHRSEHQRQFQCDSDPTATSRRRLDWQLDSDWKRTPVKATLKEAITIEMALK